MVTIHDTNLRALSDEFGHDVQPSTSTNIAVKELIFLFMLFFTPAISNMIQGHDL